VPFHVRLLASLFVISGLLTILLGLSALALGVGAAALVPLEVPVRRICASCGGRGESWTDPCSACLGAGDAPARLVVRVPLPPGLVDGASLRFRLSSPEAPPMRLDIQVSIAGFLPGV